MDTAMAMQAIKVGFFDSGIGGRCILDAFKALRPEVETLYIADSDHCPYGNRPDEEIFELSHACVRRLLAEGCRMVVIACNTATAAAINRLRALYPKIPFVGLEPAIKPAALKSKSGVVAVLATRGTFNGRLYQETAARFANKVTLLATVADEFVTEVERLKGKNPLTLPPPKLARLRKIVAKRIDPLLAAGADYLVLGCTHFPHLRPLIEKLAAGRATVIDSTDAVARQAVRVLVGLENEIF